MKKVLSFLVVLAMVMALVPVTAMAADVTVTAGDAADLLAKVAGASTGDTINIPAGTYELTGQINITENITLKGAGSNLTILKAPAAGYTGTPSGKGYSSIIHVNNAGAVIEDLTVQGAKTRTFTTGNDFGHGINVVGGTVTLNNVISQNNDAAGLVVNGAAVTANNYIARNNGWGQSVNMGDNTGSASFNFVSGALSDSVQIRMDKVTEDEGRTVVIKGVNIGNIVTTYPNGHSTVAVIGADGTITFYDNIVAANAAISAGDELKVYSNSASLVTAGVDPTFTIVIPEVVDFGALTKTAVSSVKQQDFYVEAQNLVIEQDAKIQVKVNSDFILSDGNATNTLDYKLYNVTSLTGATELANGNVYHEFLANEKVDGKLTVDQFQIVKAGSYSDTMVFTITYVEAA